MINVFGADHSGYVTRLKAAVKAVSNAEADLDVKVMQLVRLLKNGEPFKMSKRSGDLVLLSDVVEEVGRDATRFMLLYRRNEQAMDFDFALVKEQTRDNPVFYVQYAHARTHSVFRTAANDVPGLDVSPKRLAGCAAGAALHSRRSRADPASSRNGRAPSLHRHLRTSPIALHFTCTSWQRPFTPSGPRGKTTGRYALLTLRT